MARPTALVLLIVAALVWFTYGAFVTPSDIRPGDVTVERETSRHAQERAEEPANPLPLTESARRTPEPSRSHAMQSLTDTDRAIADESRRLCKLQLRVISSESGQMITGGYVSVAPMSQPTLLSKYSTDDDGLAVHRATAENGTLFVAEVEAPGFQKQRFDGLFLGGAFDCELVPVGGLVKGQVLSPSGLPVPGAPVRIDSAFGGVWSSTRQITNNDGRFQFSSLSPGDYVIAAASHPYGESYSEAKILETEQCEVLLQLRASEPVRVQVVWQRSGEAVEGAVLRSAMGLETVSGADGVAIVDWLGTERDRAEVVEVEVGGTTIESAMIPANAAASHTVILELHEPIRHAVRLEGIALDESTRIVFSQMTALGTTELRDAHFARSATDEVIAYCDEFSGHSTGVVAEVMDTRYVGATTVAARADAQMIENGELPALACEVASPRQLEVTFDREVSGPHWVVALTPSDEIDRSVIARVTESGSAVRIDQSGRCFFPHIPEKSNRLAIFDQEALWHEVTVDQDWPQEIHVPTSRLLNWTNLSVSPPVERAVDSFRLDGPQGQSVQLALQGQRALLPRDLDGWEFVIVLSGTNRPRFLRVSAAAYAGLLDMVVRFDQ